MITSYSCLLGNSCYGSVFPVVSGTPTYIYRVDFFGSSGGNYNYVKCVGGGQVANNFQSSSYASFEGVWYCPQGFSIEKPNVFGDVYVTYSTGTEPYFPQIAGGGFTYEGATISLFLLLILVLFFFKVMSDRLIGVKKQHTENY